ncbi:hypothetical protein [Bacillus badius]|uniref:Uncharacterized protein n=1 Tax=Bacillus badius TaxID=1455 RepID=A0ABR5AWT8_BACBA|nr:hypothetical protein [Bacillus badius]KIL76224.1 hypothetical protein SD78_0326 [Bacillus badius]KIL79211.1 hypothetical protein SD77_3077 [Bacillus badius]KZO00224.1 hypothetical protein A4244_04870 [Bacillus badius]KZR59928.1 hypothetical protein A3781_10650 [Bacillus badius]MED0668263.1 hypothetical protein [Bacillus badius]
MKKNIQLLPIVASIGIGAVAYSMMTGRSGQLPSMIPQLTGMGGGGMNNQPARSGHPSMR